MALADAEEQALELVTLVVRSGHVVRRETKGLEIARGLVVQLRGGAPSSALSLSSASHAGPHSALALTPLVLFFPLEALADDAASFAKSSWCWA